MRKTAKVFCDFRRTAPFFEILYVFSSAKKISIQYRISKKGGGTRKSGFVRLFALVKLSEAHDGNVRHDGVLAREYAPRLLLRYP